MNFLDLVTDELKAQIKLASQEARGQFKNERPYREEQKRVSRELDEFLGMTPSQLSELRNMYGDVPVDNYLNQMKKILRREGRRGSAIIS